MTENIGKKFESEKLRYDLIQFNALKEYVKVLTFGDKKYSPNNWKKVTLFKERYIAAALRHISEKYMLGEIFDKESKCHSLAHAICCLMFILEIELEKENYNEGE